jgi:hypothetical protein
MHLLVGKVLLIRHRCLTSQRVADKTNRAVLRRFDNSNRRINEKKEHCFCGLKILSLVVIIFSINLAGIFYKYVIEMIVDVKTAKQCSWDNLTCLYLEM